MLSDTTTAKLHYHASKVFFKNNLVDEINTLEVWNKTVFKTL